MGPYIAPPWPTCVAHCGCNIFHMHIVLSSWQMWCSQQVYLQWLIHKIFHSVLAYDLQQYSPHLSLGHSMFVIFELMDTGFFYRASKCIYCHQPRENNRGEALQKCKNIEGNKYNGNLLLLPTLTTLTTATSTLCCLWLIKQTLRKSLILQPSSFHPKQLNILNPNLLK